MAVYYNLILFDQRDPQIRLESSNPTWRPNGSGTRTARRWLTLHQGVKWHDGKPFTAEEVPCTIDLRATVSGRVWSWSCCVARWAG